jgi:ribonuclease HI
MKMKSPKKTKTMTSRMYPRMKRVKKTFLVKRPIKNLTVSEELRPAKARFAPVNLKKVKEHSHKY